MRTATVVSKSYNYKTLCLVLLFITALSASGYSQKEVHGNIADHQGETVSGENKEEPKPVGVDIMRSNFNSGNRYAEEFWRQTNKAYEEAKKAISNYAETYNETMDMVREELDKWQGDYAQGYNETMEMVRKKDRLPGIRYGTDGLKRFNRSAESDTILRP